MNKPRRLILTGALLFFLPCFTACDRLQTDYVSGKTAASELSKFVIARPLVCTESYLLPAVYYYELYTYASENDTGFRYHDVRACKKALETNPCAVTTELLLSGVCNFDVFKDISVSPSNKGKILTAIHANSNTCLVLSLLRYTRGF